jgi:hypothetical protein
MRESGVNTRSSGGSAVASDPPAEERPEEEARPEEEYSTVLYCPEEAASFAEYSFAES